MKQCQIFGPADLAKETFDSVCMFGRVACIPEDTASRRGDLHWTCPKMGSVVDDRRYNLTEMAELHGRALHHGKAKQSGFTVTVCRVLNKVRMGTCRSCPALLSPRAKHHCTILSRDAMNVKNSPTFHNGIRASEMKKKKPARSKCSTHVLESRRTENG